MSPEEKTYRDLLKDLTCKEQKLVAEYLIDGNVTRAAKKAGYSERSATQTGHETIIKHDVSAAVEAGLAAMRVRCEVDADKLVRELAAITFSNLSHYCIDDEGYVALEEGAPAEALKALQNVRRKKYVRTTEDGDTETNYETEFRLWDKVAAATLLGKKLKLFVDKVEIENAQDEVYKALLREAQAREKEERR